MRRAPTAHWGTHRNNEGIVVRRNGYSKEPPQQTYTHNQHVSRAAVRCCQVNNLASPVVVVAAAAYKHAHESRTWIDEECCLLYI
mmetsp:Transcript_12678/g.36874  ORF Transcript_12678/g.36874 Transcript_12678/m.36874 type:complete len:85 (+) Transcript_12678:1902-2156(+)